jgi:hypothetical protein
MKRLFVFFPSCYLYAAMRHPDWEIWQLLRFKRDAWKFHFALREEATEHLKNTPREEFRHVLRACVRQIEKGLMRCAGQFIYNRKRLPIPNHEEGD